MVDKVLSRAEEDIEFLTVGAETKERVIQFIFKIRPHQRKPLNHSISNKNDILPVSDILYFETEFVKTKFA